jgi:hypothetical protein
VHSIEAVAFHVEISRGFRHARAFNLDEDTLRTKILEPWVRGRVIVLGDKDWEPRDCKLRILEGPELADMDLAMGRGWSNAEKTAENVTRRLVDEAVAPAAAPVVAIVAETPSGEEALARMLKRLGLETAAWGEVRGRILEVAGGSGGPRYAAVVAFETPTPPGSWLFDAGLARGALGRSALVAQLGDTGIPVELTGVDVIRLDPDDEASVGILGDRLRR